MRCLFLLSLFATFSLILTKKAIVTEKVIFDIEIDGEKAGKIEIGLCGKIVPKTVKNFVGLCNRPYGKGYKGIKLQYDRTWSKIFSSNFSANDGLPELSIYGKPFPNENYKLKQYVGWVMMVRYPDFQSNVQFFIEMMRDDSLKRKNVVFGKVIQGMNVLRAIQSIPGYDEIYLKDAVVADCTSEVVQKPFAVEKSDVTDE